MSRSFDPGAFAAHPRELVLVLERVFADGGEIRLTAAGLASGHYRTEAQAEALLEAVVAGGFLERRVTERCPRCAELLDEQAATTEICPHCQEAFADHGGIIRETSYIADRPPRRSVQWVLCLHGMNTPGRWQEALQWQIAKSYGRMVPVAIYKYGIVRPGVLFRRRHRQLVNELARRLESFRLDATGAGYGTPPDVLAHSLGTLILGKALQANSNLKLGRVILTGCILPPDFPWSQLKTSGQVEEILNHRGSKDFWARIARFVIPDSGPMGRQGALDLAVVDVLETGFTHSKFFEDEELGRCYETVWEPFWTGPPGAAANRWPNRPEIGWSRRWWRWREPGLRGLLAILLAGLVVLLALAVARGLWEFVS